MTEMRVLTVRQPWAWAIIHGGKNIENRVRNIAGDYRGPVAIHVASKYAEDLNSNELDETMTDWFNENPNVRQWPWLGSVGLIIGVVDLVGVHQGATRCTPWAEPGAWHLELSNPRALTVPMEWKGALGLRRLPAETAAMVLELQRG